MRDHKSLKAWIESHQVVRLVLDLARDHWRPELGSVFHHLTRASLSTQINISEGYSLGTRRQFLRHLRIAYASAIETADLLELIQEQRPSLSDQISLALRHDRCCQRLLLGLIKKYQVA